MLVVADKILNPKHIHLYLHVPKCGGTYAKKMLKQYIKSNLEDCFFAKTDMHQSLDSICGYRTHNKAIIQGITTHHSKVNQSMKYSLSASCALRNPFEWYDSYYYYKKKYSERKGVYLEPMAPLNANTNDYEKAISNSLDDDYIKKCSHAVLQQGFCPSVWMKELDIGFYTAWFLYTVSDHKSVFDNIQKIRGNNLLQTDVSIVRSFFNNIMFFDIKHLDAALQSFVSNFVGKDIVYESQKKERATEYNKNYLSSRNILKSNKNLLDLFMWKERFMFASFYKKEIQGFK